MTFLNYCSLNWCNLLEEVCKDKAVLQSRFCRILGSLMILVLKKKTKTRPRTEVILPN